MLRLVGDLLQAGADPSASHLDAVQTHLDTFGRRLGRAPNGQRNLRLYDGYLDDDYLWDHEWAEEEHTVVKSSPLHWACHEDSGAAAIGH